jgi:molecular chaperone GrpE
MFTDAKMRDEALFRECRSPGEERVEGKPREGTDVHGRRGGGPTRAELAACVAGLQEEMEVLRRRLDEAEALAESRKKLLEEMEKELAEKNEESARFRADFHNFRQRTERDAARLRELAAERAVTLLIPVLDNLDRAIAAAQADDPLLKGVSMVRKQFFGALQELGVSVITCDGAFDPAVHEAVALVPVQDPARDGQIVQELQKGYLLGGKVLRAAQVHVGRFQADSDSEEE